MNYRRLGRTNLVVSAVGFGTCQLRLVPERQAMATLLRGFELGVNLVHTAPDYDGADDLVARAVQESGRDVIVCSQGFGPIDLFERLFEDTCSKLGKERLELFGIACVDDREALGENLWGAGGMVDFLLRKKADGRLQGIFCTTHGGPDYLKKLLAADVFDAVMLAYNPLGFHLLSYYPGNDRVWEDLPATRDEIIPLAWQRDVGVMIMKPLAGGLLCRGKTFPPRAEIVPQQARAGDVLRSILAIEGVTCVVPGTNSVAEAEENALAGHGRLSLPETRQTALASQVRVLDTALCSRCGKCESSCSQGLRVSYLFRDAYLHLFPSETFEVIDDLGYFRLHPGPEAACATCTDQTCSCPGGLDIPRRLIQVHELMKELEPTGQKTDSWARLIHRDVPPGPFMPGQEIVVRLSVENTSGHLWTADPSRPGTSARPELVVSVNGRARQKVPLRHDVHPGQRGHFAFALEPLPGGSHEVRFDLTLDSQPAPAPVGQVSLVVEGGPSRPWLVALARRAARLILRACKVRAGQLPPASVAIPAVPEHPSYGVAYLAHNMPSRVPAGTRLALWLEIENQGTKVWQPAPRQGQPVDVALFLDGTLVTCARLPVEEVRPGERVTLCGVFLSPTAAGPHELKVDMVEQNVTFFADQGVAPLVVPFETAEAAPTATSRLMERALKSNYSFSAPSQMVSWRPDGGTYPIFARSARGCRVTDVEGRDYIDYVMGWGCSLLGHANERIQNAVRNALDSSALISLPHLLEMEVTDAICAAIPCAEMVLFGKNGSDVCTAAARLARVTTGRQKLLVCGYHGWQDWHVEKWGFGMTGVPDRQAPLLFMFPLNDTDAFVRLMEQHRGEVAGVMIEPAGPIEGLNGPVRDADPSFLRTVADVTRREGAVLIFDEIITGFRYRQGSLQKATGVIPDLACLGKALSAGMPLSALVGRRQLFNGGLERIFFGPTFKSEVYSFAAAREALTLYSELDVPTHVWAYGERLRRGVNERCKEAGVLAALIGPPFRMLLRFAESDPVRVTLMRTLLQQELIKGGVLTYKGVMLPSLAHDDQALEQTFRAFERALPLLARASRENNFVRYLEIPAIT